jgi:hypothetical protein
MADDESRALAEALSGHLTGLTGDSLATYLKETYSVSEQDGLSTDTVYLVEVDSADMATGHMSSVPVHWWAVRGTECRRTEAVNMRPFNDASDAGHLWPHPNSTKGTS